MTMYIEPASSELQLRMHLMQWHGIWHQDVKAKNVDSLREAHNSDHADHWSHASIPHTHVDGQPW